jgi:hypothetical protein
LFFLPCPRPSDSEFQSRWVKRRDEDAFTALAARHGCKVFSVFGRVLGNTHDPKDAIQAVCSAP